MAEQWFIPSGVMPLSGVMIDEDGEEEYFIPALGMFNEDQAAAEPSTISDYRYRMRFFG